MGISPKSKKLKSSYTERIYRSISSNDRLVGFEVKVKETDLLIKASRRLIKEAIDYVLKYRGQIESYIELRPIFKETLIPYPKDPMAPEIIREMIEASHLAGVGPMASVAGAIAEYVGRDLLNHSNEVIVENGGDIYINTQEEIIVGIFAGKSPLNYRIGIRIKGNETPLGVCTSSGTIGHSMSFGKADAACIIADSSTLADAVATATGNLVKTPKDMEKAIAFASNIKGVRGAVIILNRFLSVWGNIEIVDLKGNDKKSK
jgi:ApbE superfamily uncharacterized protein (UPF0280 family)